MDLVTTLRTANVSCVDVRIPGRPGPFTPIGVMWHHTASHRRSGDLPSRRLVLEGRGGSEPLSAPVVQILVGRAGTVLVCSDGRSNHAGNGEERAYRDALAGRAPSRARTRGAFGGNAYWIGVEIENDGIGEPWPPAQLDVVAFLTAAICAAAGWDPLSRCIGHKEWTGSKIDPTFDCQAMRTRVAALTTPTPGDAPMSAAEVKQITDKIDALALGQLGIASRTQAPYTQVSVGDGTIYVIVWSGDQPVRWAAPGPAPLSMLINAGLVEPEVRHITGGEADWVKKLRNVDGLTAFKAHP